MIINDPVSLIIFIVLIALFLTISITSFWFSLCFLIRYKKKEGLLHLLLIILIHLLAVINYHKYLPAKVNQCLFLQIILLVPVIAIFQRLVNLCDFSDRKFSVSISVSFLSAIILILQPLGYLSWVKLANFVHNIWLQRAKRKIEYMINNEKELLSKKVLDISKDEELIIYITQENTEKIQDFVYQMQNRESIDIISIQIPGYATIDNSLYENNQSSILGEDDSQTQVRLKPINNELFNLATSRYIYSDAGEEMALLTIGTTLDIDYFESLKNSFMCEFLLVNQYGIYYRSSSGINLPPNTDINKLENYHFQTVESSNIPNLSLLLPIDTQSTQNGSILFETITPSFTNLVRPIALVQLILSLNIVIIFFTLDKEFKVKKKRNVE